MKKISILVYCAFCHKEIYRCPWQLKDRKMVFCNVICQRNWMNTQKGSNSLRWNSVEVCCANCGNKLYRTPYQIKITKHFFCDQTCHYNWSSKNLRGENSHSWQQGIEVTCAYCDKKSYRKPYSLKGINIVFCNEECRQKWEHSHTGKDNRGWKCVEGECFWCKKKFMVQPSKLKMRQHIFCSKKCTDLWKKTVRGKEHPNTGKKRNVSPIEKMRAIVRMKTYWQDPEFVRKQMRSRGVRPNKPELKLQEILNKVCPNEYKYVGDGEFILAGKCPDFMNVNGKKKLIELYGRYWHKDDKPEDRIAIFKPYGYDTLIIWDNELKDERKLKDTLLEFHNKKMEHVAEGV